MGFKPIETPRGSLIQGPNGKAELKWNPGFEQHINGVLSKKQEIIDSEVLHWHAGKIRHAGHGDWQW